MFVISTNTLFLEALHLNLKCLFFSFFFFYFSKKKNAHNKVIISQNGIYLRKNTPKMLML